MRMKLIGLAVALGIGTGVLHVCPPMAHAQDSATGWSTPDLLYAGQDQILAPAVIADQAGGVHVFWSLIRQSTQSGQSRQNLIYYTRLLGRSWSSPTDVVAISSATAPTGAVDNLGTVHLFWEEGTALYTTSAPVDGAAAASAWAARTFVGYANQNGGAAADASGGIHVAYPGQGASGVVYQASTDGGVHWSFPVTVSPTAGPNVAADFVRIAVGPDGTIHVVWTEFQLPNGWPPLGVYYSNSTDGGKTWSDPIQIAGQGFTQGNVAAGPRGIVHVAWNGMAGVRGRYDRWSTNDGKTWSNAATLTTPLRYTLDVGGSTGPPGLAVDSAGVFHVLFLDGNRVWHSSWKDGHWSQAEYVPSGNEAGLPPVDQPIETKTRHIEQAVMTLSQGNLLHVVFWDERQGQKLTYVWHTAKRVVAPSIAPVAFTTVTPTPVPQLTPTRVARTSTPVTLSSAQSVPAVTPPLPPPDPRWAILIGVGPIALVVGGIVAFQLWSARR